MTPRYSLFRRGQMFYCQDALTKQQTSLRTNDKTEAQTLLNAKNEAVRQPQLNLQIARAYLTASDPQVSARTWQTVMEEMLIGKTGSTLVRYTRVFASTVLDPIRSVPILETRPQHFFKVLDAGLVSTNIFLRRIHNHALGMSYQPWPIIPKKKWPQVRFKDKRAITASEHDAIITLEHNPERRAYYQCCWHLGRSQTDVANLTAQDIEWEGQVISFHRIMTKAASIIRFGTELAAPPWQLGR